MREEAQKPNITLQQEITDPVWDSDRSLYALT
jgi:hypothetical protein